jgi:hypothetical protein
MAKSTEPTIVKIDFEHRGTADTTSALAKAVEVRSRALAQEQPHPFRKSFLRLYLCLAVAYMCSSTNGFDANTFGTRLPLISESSLTTLGGLSAELAAPSHLHWQVEYMNRTILSTLEPESDTQKRQRELLVRKNRTWTNSGNTLVAVGPIIGQVHNIGVAIKLQGTDELVFQDERDQHGDGQRKLCHEIMSLWGKIFTKDVAYRNFVNERLRGPFLDELDELPEFREFPYFGQLVSTAPNPPRNSVEYHLLNRSRKTVTWTDDNNKAVTVIIDKSLLSTGRGLPATNRRKRGSVGSQRA